MKLLTILISSYRAGIVSQLTIMQMIVVSERQTTSAQETRFASAQPGT